MWVIQDRLSRYNLDQHLRKDELLWGKIRNESGSFLFGQQLYLFRNSEAESKLTRTASMNLQHLKAAMAEIFSNLLGMTERLGIFARLTC
jgi:hypothetical protein